MVSEATDSRYSLRADPQGNRTEEHTEFQADTFKCSSGAIKPNPPQRMDKSAQSCGQVPNCGNHLKHLAALVGTPAPSPYSNRACHRCVCRCHLTWHSHSSSTHRGWHCQCHRLRLQAWLHELHPALEVLSKQMWPALYLLCMRIQQSVLVR